MRLRQHPFNVHDIDGSPLCWLCAEAEPELDDRWCSPRCRAAGERMLDSTPMPDEIAELTAEIREGWDSREHLRRLHDFAGLDEVLELLRWTPPVVERWGEL